MDALLDQARTIYEGEIVSPFPLLFPPIISLTSTGLPRPIPRRANNLRPPLPHRRPRLPDWLLHPGHLQYTLHRRRRNDSYVLIGGSALAVFQY